MMNDSFELITVDETNVAEHGFFCYKSKPKSPGYQKKMGWLRERSTEGLKIKILYENGRSVGFIEYIPGEHTWRAVNAPGQLVIHCLWVVGRAKGKSHGSRLLEECLEEARQQGKSGVVMVSSRGNWLASEKVFLKNGFAEVGSAPPSFKLLVKPLNGNPEATFPQDWDDRLAQFTPGATIIYADQCPYMPNVVQFAVDQFSARGIEARVVRLENSAEVRAKSPTPYGVFAIVVDGRLLTYHYLGTKELRRLDEEFLA